MGLYNSRKSVWERKKNNLVTDNCGAGTPDDTPKVEEVKIVEKSLKSISDPVKKNKNIPQNLPEDDK
jgi:hypothetical protein